MLVDCGIKTHALDPADHLGDLSLVYRSEMGGGRGLDHSRGSGEVLYQREVLLYVLGQDYRLTGFIENTDLVHIHRADSQGVNNIDAGRRPLAPLLHLDGAQIVWRVDIAGLPLAWHLLEVVVGHLLGLEELHLGILLADICVGAGLGALEHAFRSIAAARRRIGPPGRAAVVEVGEAVVVRAGARMGFAGGARCGCGRGG